MIYSCFDDKTGQYAYYQDSKTLPINADLPVPKLSSVIGKIGIPAIESGRPLPIEAQYVGHGWFPRGILAQKNSGSSVGDFADDSVDWVKGGGWKWLLGGAAVLFVLHRI